MSKKWKLVRLLAMIVIPMACVIQSFVEKSIKMAKIRKIFYIDHYLMNINNLFYVEKVRNLDDYKKIHLMKMVLAGIKALVVTMVVVYTFSYIYALVNQ